MTDGVREPREQAETMASDWEWIKKTLIMCSDRAVMGDPLRLTRPDSVPAHWDLVDLFRRNAHRMIDDIFSTAIVVEPEEPDAGP